MTGVKMCGLTRLEDVGAACALGATYVGFNFSADSPRRVTLETARRLAEVARGVIRVGVFVDETRDQIEAAAEAARLDLLQIHRPLQEEDLELPLPVIAVMSIGERASLGLSEAILSRCQAVLLDSDDARRGGPVRSPFDWSLAQRMRPRIPLILGGGLTSDNVAEAIRQVRPAAVDVASGVEREPGVKDHAKMRRFFRAVKEADAQ